MKNIKNLPYGLEKFEKEFCESEIPSAFNIYNFIRNHKETTISAAMCRIRRIFNRADTVMIGVSGGKDSTLTLELSILELQYRKELIENIKSGHIKEYYFNNKNEFGKYEELENINENIPDIICNSMDSEWIYSDPQNHIRNDISQRFGKGCFIFNKKLVLGIDILPKDIQNLDKNIITFYDYWESCKNEAKLEEINIIDKAIINKVSKNLLNDIENKNVKRYSNISSDDSLNKILKTNLISCIYEGNNTIKMFYKCLELGWQSGVTFSDSRLVSWDPQKQDMWIREMPTRFDQGVDICRTGRLKNINYTPINYINKNLIELHKNDIQIINGIPCIPNFGYGNNSLNSYRGIPDEYWNGWSFKNQNEDMEQETFGEWILRNSVPGAKIYNLVSLRAAESFDRYTILKQSNYYTGEYATQKSRKNKDSVIHICSPIMDLTTADVWRLFSATNWPVSKIYEKMYEAGIGIENQRIGSLLNFCATKNISQIKALEPDMYAKINSRFQNIEFMANFSKNGYYKIGKPADSMWNGRNHIKAGISEEDNNLLSDKYENILKKYSNKLKDIGIVSYNRENNIFKFQDNRKQGNILKQINPLNELLNLNSIEKTDLDLVKELNNIHITWRDYCLYMLNTTSDPLRSNWKEKLITDILAWKYSEKATELSTIDALNILSELNQNIVKKVTDDEWTKDDFHLSGTLPISGKVCISISHYPQESLEKECSDVINYLIENNLFDELKNSPSFMKFAKRCVKTKTMVFPTMISTNCINSLGVIKGEEYYTDKEINNITDFSEEWIKRIRKGLNIWFKENVHSTSNWKRFAINILKGDVVGKYVGFSQTLSERAARAKASEAFSQNQKEKSKAKIEAENLIKKINSENKFNLNKED